MHWPLCPITYIFHVWNHACLFSKRGGLAQREQPWLQKNRAQPTWKIRSSVEALEPWVRSTAPSACRLGRGGRLLSPRHKPLLLLHSALFLFLRQLAASIWIQTSLEILCRSCLNQVNSDYYYYQSFILRRSHKKQEFFLKFVFTHCQHNDSLSKYDLFLRSPAGFSNINFIGFIWFAGVCFKYYLTYFTVKTNALLYD